MPLHPPTRRRRTALAIGGAVAVALAVTLSIARPWLPPAETAPVAAAESGLSPAALALPEDPEVLVFGDSWTYGSAATVPTDGYAYRLARLIAGDTVVRGVRGSGYQRPGVDGPDFLTRVAELETWIDPDLIILQGSINDRRSDAAAYPAAVNAVWDAVVAKYPGIPIVILGPAPHELPVGASTARIDRDLAGLAAARGWWYISPVQEDWITESNYLQLIDAGVGRKHPSDAGHAYLADKVAAALERFGTAPVTAADGAKPKPAK
ncbi:SGNH/GDSL hydrolase family protein [Microbacterium esteraromaticum]|uniref:SGNH/GDSL hydrolase family protein n=1 Tax=Microbacterium esteraromaticum TaxID=57043 RepID=A0A7D8AE14_9MICO|nr:SGNH/GDSL hydrolase family protein [Microbacterium esteraromaticum]QMU97864.1 SGNH/GDSL hydrolase family protein [Microbacterium esteraromaticum]